MPYLIQFPDCNFLHLPTEKSSPRFVAREHADEYATPEAAEEPAKRFHGMVIDAETDIVMSDYTERKVDVEYREDWEDDDQACDSW